MSDPTRLLSREGGATDFERELLGSWDAEQPSDEARAKVLAIAALGVGIGGTAAALAKAGAAAGGSVAPKAASFGTAALVKWLILGAVAAAAAGMTLAYVRAAHRAPAAAAVAPPPPFPPAPTPIATTTTFAPSPSIAAASAAPARQDLPAARGASSPRHAPSAVGSERASEKTTADDALGEEVSLLDRARRALADGDPPGALRTLDAFNARFPRGALVEEAEVLRVEALLAEDDRASATKVGARFLATHPASPHAARIRSLLARAPGP